MTAPVEARSRGKGTQMKGGLQKGSCVIQVDGRPRRERPDKVRPEQTTRLGRREQTQDTWADPLYHSPVRELLPGTQRTVGGTPPYAGRRHAR